MGYFNFYFLKKLLSKVFTKKTLIYIIIFLIIIIIKSNVFAVYTPYDLDVDIYYNLVEKQRDSQNNFVFMMMYPFYGNTISWNDLLKPVLDDIKENQYDFYITYTKNSSYIEYRVALYHVDDAVRLIEGTEYMNVGDTTGVVIRKVEFPSNSKRYVIRYYPSTNEHTVTTGYGAWQIPDAVKTFKSELFLQFMNLVYGNITQQSFFNSIENYLDSIDEVTIDILSELNTLSGVLSTISNNTSTNYSQQISQISGKIDDILTDNDTIISQNSSMIEQQEQINDNLENINDTLTDDTVESSASDLPSTNVNNPTENGIDNIFTSIYNAFCVGEAQDIVFPIPFTNKNITLSPYYVRDMLNNNNAGWIYTLIQAFWGYLIGRYIVSDISKKIDKIKSGNIENVENSNIKEEML